MKAIKFAVICLLFAGIAAAKEHDYRRELCFAWIPAPAAHRKRQQERRGRNPRHDSQNKKTKELLCQEYILQAEHVVYRIRPTDEKHPVLLPHR